MDQSSNFNIRCRRVAILEFVTGGGFVSQPLDETPPSLIREGRAMLEALASDWAALDDWEVLITWDFRLPAWADKNPEIKVVEIRDAYEDAWLQVARQVDFVLVIAPEMEGILGRVLESLRYEGARLINSDAIFLRATSDKWQTTQALMRAGIEHPSTWLLDQIDDENLWNEIEIPSPFGWVVKPRDGVGCTDVRRFDSLVDVRRYVENELFDQAERNRFLLQPWIDGVAGSVAILCGRDDICVLPAMQQRIHCDQDQSTGQIAYLGGNGPWMELDQARIEDFARSVIEALSGEPRGWVGIGFVLVNHDSESIQNSIVAIEVNPRLTTSYLGLRRIVKENLASLIVRSFSGEVPRYSLSGKAIEFDSFGKVISVELH